MDEEQPREDSPPPASTFHGPLTQEQINETLKRLRTLAEHDKACTKRR